MKTLTTFHAFLSNLNRESAWEASRTFFAVIGVGSALGSLSILSNPITFILGTTLISGSWYGIYRLYEGVK